MHRGTPVETSLSTFEAGGSRLGKREPPNGPQFRVLSLGFRVWGLGFRARAWTHKAALALRARPRTDPGPHELPMGSI